MAGMQTQLNLLAHEAGRFTGRNQNFTGRGYPNMHFQANAVSREEFESWVQKVKQSPDKLDLDRYGKLTKPNEGYYPVTYFSSVKPDLFTHILRTFNPTWGENSGFTSQGSGTTHPRTDVAEAH